MRAAFRSLGSLLGSIGLLLIGHDMQLTLLPQIGESFGWSAAQNALTTSAYFFGYVVGCFCVPAWLQRIGHIRVFTVLVALSAAILLCLTLVPELWCWLVLRGCYGVAISGIYLAVESWLNAASDPVSRGNVLSVYAFVTLVAILLAQFVLSAAEQAPATLAAIFILLAVVPIGVTRLEAPQVVQAPTLSISRLANRANAVTFVGGLLNGTFWALAPIAAARFGLGASDVALFVALAVGGGMVCVYPFGIVSDRIGRRPLIAVLGALGVVSSAAYLGFGAESRTALLTYAFIFGATVMPLYSLCLALANDMAGADDFVQTGGVVIVMNAAGMVVGPVIAGFLMTGGPPQRLVMCWLVAFALLPLTVRFAAARDWTAPGSPAQFHVMPRSVPEALAMDPRAYDESGGEIMPPEIESGGTSRDS